MKKFIWTWIVLLICLGLFTGCSAGKNEGNEHLPQLDIENQANGDEVGTHRFDREIVEPIDDRIDQPVQRREITLYFLNRAQYSLVPETRRIVLSQEEYIFSKIIEALSLGPMSRDLEPVISAETKLESVSNVDGIVTINLTRDFLQAEDLLVARAALVNTLVNIEGVEFVKIYIAGKELTRDGTQEGEVLGVLARHENNLNDVIAQEDIEFGREEVRQLDWELYFQDKEGEFLLSEIRTINVINMEFARTIVEELIKGPAAQNQGLYPTIPPGVRLIEVKLKKAEQPEGKDGLELHFSDDFAAGIQDRTGLERIAIGSLVYSLTSLNNVGWVSVVYRGAEVISPAEASEPQDSFETRYVREDFESILGRRIKTYFSDSNAMHLVPEYRAMSRGNRAIARTVINELIEGPVYDGNLDVMPYGISPDEIRVRVQNGTAFVDLSSGINFDQMGSTGETMALYAIVNSLTDPVNTKNIERVQFLVDGKIVEGLGHISLTEPFIRNPALIDE